VTAGRPAQRGGLPTGTAPPEAPPQLPAGDWSASR